MKRLAIIALVVAIYWLGGQLGLLVAVPIPPGNVTAVWPPSPLAWTALLLFGYNVWPGIWLGDILVNAPGYFESSREVIQSIVIAGSSAVGSTLEGILGAFLIQRFIGYNNLLNRAKNVFKFVLITVACPMLSATIGISCLCIGSISKWTDFYSLWYTWWIGNTVTLLVLVPLLLVWSQKQRKITKTSETETTLISNRDRISKHLNRKIWVEKILLIGLLVSVSYFTFYHSYPIEYMLIPGLAWAAFRFGQRGVTLAGAFVSTLAVWGTSRGLGSLIRQSPSESMALLQAFMGVVSVTALLLVAVLTESQAAEVKLKRTNEQLTVEIGERQQAEVALRYSEEVAREQAKQLEAYSQTLEQRVSERTQELQQEIRDRQRAEAELQESQRVLSTLMSNLPGIAYRCLFDDAWTMKFVSKGCFDLTGYHSDELLNNQVTSYENVIYQDDREMVRREIGKAVAQQHPFQIVYRIVTASGELKWVWEQGQGIFSEKNELIALEGFITDISLQKQVEQELEQAKTLADAANQSKSEFLSKMSHELRTPLNIILGFTQVLNRDRTLAPKQQEYLTTINRAGEHLLTLINDVLEMSKIEAGRVVLNPVDFDLYYLLETLEEMLKIKADSRGLQLIFERGREVPQFIQADESKLRQVLINLLGNALKFTQQGFVKLSVNLCNSDGKAAQTCLQFEVEDTGPGIPPQEIDRLFEPFVQTKAGHQSQEGTGLGLPISRQFVQLMGGELKVSSRLDLGTTFAFDIQISPGQISKVKSPFASRRVIQLEPNQRTYRILVVEDNLDSRLLLVNLLSQVGFSVKAATNGQEAVCDWETWEPDLIWMDMQMPVMDGYAATQHIKAQPRGQNTIIIALTASAFEENRTVILSAGCDDFVSKPFREEIIFEKIAQHLGTRYLYEEKSPQGTDRQPDLSQESNSGSSLSVLSFPDLSTDWILQLRQAASELDDERIRELITNIETSHPQLAKALANLVKELRFDKILELV